VSSNWHRDEAHSAHAVDRGNLRSAVRLDRDPGRGLLLGHPRDLQTHRSGDRVRLPAAPLDRCVHLQGDRVPGEPAVKHHEGRTTRANAEANTQEKVSSEGSYAKSFAMILDLT
jgi:hypothetical protein